MSLNKTTRYAGTTTAALALTLTACGGGTGTNGAGGSHDKNATVNIGSLYEP